MKKALWLVPICGLLLLGCDVKQGPPNVDLGDGPNVLKVPVSEPAELEAATATEVARINYDYRLRVLESYYANVGYGDKLTWARRELENLRGAQRFSWKGLPEVTPPEGESLVNADERLLVEYAVGARGEYLQAVENLLSLYEAQNKALRARFIRNLQARFDPVRTYMYFLEAEIPGPDLRPVQVIPRADEMFAQAHKLFREGKGVLHTFLSTDYQKEREAIELFRGLIRRYPNSTKIALSAYYIADIYKEYFNEDVRAVHWYERAWQWNPALPQPARFQAATIYDIRLHNPEKAVDLYEKAIQYEQFNDSNVAYAARRIQELTASR